MIITVQSIKQPAEGRKSGQVITTDGERLWLWANKLGKIKLGATYDVSIEERNGFKNIGTFTETAAPAAHAAVPASSAPAAAPVQQFRTPEQITVSEIICAYIANGRCPPEKLTETMRYVRKAWRETFAPPITGYPQAAE